MQITINLATASLKEAEHAIFIIGAYFGMTDLPNVGDTVVNGPAPGAAVVLPRSLPPAPGGAPVVPLAAENPAATFGATPPVLPPGAGEALDTRDPAQVFAGNAATGPATLPGLPAAGPSALPAAGPVVGDVGNVAGTVAGPVGTPVPQTPAPAASAPPGVELDKNGLPWDNRIHASGEGGKKPKNADGSWRKKRGLNNAALIARIEAELRATMAAGTPTVQPPAVAPPAPPVPQPPAMPQPPAPPVQPPAPAAVADPTTFEQLMPRITAAVMAGTLPQTALLQAVTAYQLPNIPALAQRPDLVPTVWAYLRSMYPALQ